MFVSSCYTSNSNSCCFNIPKRKGKGPFPRHDNTYVRFSAISIKWASICDFTFVFMLTNPSEKQSALKGKKSLPLSQFFLLRVDPFSEGSKNNFDRVAFPWKCIQLPGLGGSVGCVSSWWSGREFDPCQIWQHSLWTLWSFSPFCWF